MEEVRLTSADGSTEARFVPEANMLCCSLSYQGTELLDQGHGVRAYAEQGKTMGVPLLHPWANRLAGFEYSAADKTVQLSMGDPRIPHDPSELPIHGVLPGLLAWDLDDQVAGDRIGAHLRWAELELLELFPFVHELRVAASVSPGALAVETSLIATGEDTVPVSFGYHPYVRLPGARREDWGVTVAASRRLILDERMIPTGEREPVASQQFVLGDESLDDGFDGLTTPARFEVSAADASLVVAFRRGYPFAQVYAPPGREFICFEPMTAPANALVSGDGLSLVSAGETYRAAFSIEITGS